MTKLYFLLHFDTKKVEKVQEDIKIKVITERLPLSVFSPNTEKLDLLLGVLEIESSAGQVQANAIRKIFLVPELLTR